jgi:putative oxidoreductase
MFALPPFLNTLLFKIAPWLQSIALLAARLWLAKAFWASGLTKIANWQTTIDLFRDEYKVPILSPELAAYAAMAGEFALPVLLVLGFLTPLGALGIMAMTLVIELFVFPGTTEHYYWLMLAGILVSFGSGKFGVDAWIWKRG